MAVKQEEMFDGSDILGVIWLTETKIIDAVQSGDHSRLEHRGYRTPPQASFELI